jgi:hypothetical protein
MSKIQNDMKRMILVFGILVCGNNIRQNVFSANCPLWQNVFSAKGLLVKLLIRQTITVGKFPFGKMHAKYPATINDQKKPLLIALYAYRPACITIGGN